MVVTGGWKKTLCLQFFLMRRVRYHLLLSTAIHQLPDSAADRTFCLIGTTYGWCCPQLDQRYILSGSNQRTGFHRPPSVIWLMIVSLCSTWTSLRMIEIFRILFHSELYNASCSSWSMQTVDCTFVFRVRIVIIPFQTGYRCFLRYFTMGSSVQYFGKSEENILPGTSVECDRIRCYVLGGRLEDLFMYVYLSQVHILNCYDNNTCLLLLVH